MICPVQKWGLGDIIYEMTLVKLFNAPVTWVVEPAFFVGLQRAYPEITFTTQPPYGYDDTKRNEYEVNGCKFLPLRWADVILNVPYTHCMKAKYMLYGLDWRIWRDNAMWTRDAEQENALQAFLGISDGEHYNLINRTFRSNNTGKAAIIVENGLRNIEMSTLDGFSLFDWAKIIENATEIHTVSTSIIYILELLELKAECVDLYVRRPDEVDFRNIEYILERHKYVYHL